MSVGKNKNFSYTDLQTTLMDLYEIKFGLCNHLSKNNPFSSVLYLPSEEVNKESMREASINNYVFNSIQKFYGISYLEYTNLPNELVNQLNNIAGIFKDKESKAAEQALNTSKSM